jgi:hypothetical protein
MAPIADGKTVGQTMSLYVPLSKGTLAGEGKTGGSLAAPAVVSHPKAPIWAAADWRDVLALATVGGS